MNYELCAETRNTHDATRIHDREQGRKNVTLTLLSAGLAMLTLAEAHVGQARDERQRWDSLRLFRQPRTAIS